MSCSPGNVSTIWTYPRYMSILDAKMDTSSRRVGDLDTSALRLTDGQLVRRNGRRDVVSNVDLLMGDLLLFQESEVAVVSAVRDVETCFISFSMESLKLPLRCI